MAANGSSTYDGNLHVKGRITCETMTVPAAAVSNASVAADAKIDAEKLEHRLLKEYQQPNTAATTVTIPIHLGRGVGGVEGFAAASIAAAIGDSTVVLDLKKNGVSILTGTLTLNSTNTARVLATQTIATSAYVAGDFFELVITATIGTGTLPTGLIVQVAMHELA